MNRSELATRLASTDDEAEQQSLLAQNPALADASGDSEVAALAAWAGAVSALIDGQMGLALDRLDEAESRFLALGKPETAAATQTIKLIALAMLGRYEEAVECGLRARSV